MNKTNQLLLFSLIVSLLCASVGYVFIKKYFSNFNNLTNTQKIRIAIVEPAIHPAMDEISQGFVDALSNNSNHHYEFKKFNANGNKILMRAQAEEILQGNFDLIFTIGVGCSLTLKELCTKKQCKIPLVFTAVENPERLHLTGSTITGVSELSDYKTQLELLIALKPSIKNILLVYDASQGSGLEKDKQEISSILNNKNISLQGIEINNMGEIHQKVVGFMDHADAIMILKDNTAVSGIDSLISLSQRYRIPLLATDLNSGIKGAALAYGVREYDFGAQAGQKAKLILEHDKKPVDIPISAIENLKMKINSKQIELQGLLLDPSTLNRLTNVEIY